MKLKHRFVKSNNSKVVQLLYFLDKIQDPINFHKDPKTFSKNNNIFEDVFKQQTINNGQNENTDEPFYKSMGKISTQANSFEIQNKKAILMRKMELDRQQPMLNSHEPDVKDVLTVQYRKKNGSKSINDSNQGKQGK
jgi:hypothetical protein